MNNRLATHRVLAGLRQVLGSRARQQGRPFPLRDADVQLFLADLEEVLRADLQDDWSSRPNWKQTVEDLQVSSLVLEGVERLNNSDPGGLVALREALDAYREAARRYALGRFKVELASDWLRSPARRMAVVMESAVGLLVALFGLVNNFLILLLLFKTSLLKRSDKHEQRTNWVTGALVALTFYVVQILLVDHFLGRAAAGYYAPTLPLSAAYLYRYRWLIRYRTPPAFLALTLPRQASKLHRMRKAFIEAVNEALTAQAEIPKVAR